MVVYFHLGNRLINPLIDIDTVATLKMALFTFRLKWTLSSICWYLSCYWLFLFSTSVYCQLLQIEPFPASCCFFIFISSIRLIIYLKWPMIAGFKLLTSILLSLSLVLLPISSNWTVHGLLFFHYILFNTVESFF